MPQFRKKPVVIEARQTGLDYDEDFSIMKWCGGMFGPEPQPMSEEPDPPYLFLIPTLEGRMEVAPLDWVICGVAGEFYPVKPNIFEATYEPV